MNDGPAHGMPIRIADDHGQCASERYACLGGLFYVMLFVYCLFHRFVLSMSINLFALLVFSDHLFKDVAGGLYGVLAANLRKKLNLYDYTIQMIALMLYDLRDLS